MQFFNAETNQDPTTCCAYRLQFGQRPYPSADTGAAAPFWGPIAWLIPAGSSASSTPPTFPPA